MRKLLFASALAFAPFAAANATLIIQQAGGSTGDVVNFETIQTNVGFPTPLTGDTNKGANTVDFFNLNSTGTGYGPQLIGTDAKGQADVVCNSNCVNYSQGTFNGHLLNGMEIKMTGTTAADTMIFNLDAGIGSVAIVAQDNFGNKFTDTLKNGSNFFRVDAQPGTGEAITDVKIFENAVDPTTGVFGWNDLKQPRILACTIGVDCNGSPDLVPEPASLALLASGLLGLGFAYRRRRS
jgi:hypothetical protein